MLDELDIGWDVIYGWGQRKHFKAKFSHHTNTLYIAVSITQIAYLANIGCSLLRHKAGECSHVNTSRGAVAGSPGLPGWFSTDKRIMESSAQPQTDMEAMFDNVQVAEYRYSSFAFSGYVSCILRFLHFLCQYASNIKKVAFKHSTCYFILEFTFLNQNCVFEQITVTPFHEVDLNSNHAKLKNWRSFRRFGIRFWIGWRRKIDQPNLV